MSTPIGEHSAWFVNEVQPHGPTLRAYLVARFPSLPDVDDLVQECMVRVLRVREKTPVDAPKALLFATARNLAIDTLRRQRVIAFEPITEITDPSVFTDTIDVAEIVSKQQEAALLTQAIQTLPEKCRQVFTLRVAFGLSQREICERLGISENTVEKQLAKGVRRCGEFFVSRGII
jgi:RNA polymerase sigma factor (sigma-70 family)